MNDRWRAALLLWSMGALWPTLFEGALNLARSPLERALSQSWCTSHAASDALLQLLGHCAPCWSGAAAFTLAGAAALTFNRPRSSRAAI